MRTADGQMIQRCLDGETEAFGVLVDKYRSSMYALAYNRVRNFQDAEDITQEAFLIAYQKLKTLRRWDNFFAWMYSITSNLCKKWLKKRENRPDREHLEDQNMAAADALSLKAHHEQMVREMVHDALDELPAIYRQVLSLYYLGGMNTREIAEFLGTSVKTIESRLSRARAQLKEEMIEMMSTTFEKQRLQPGFTFRVVEAIKQTKIQSAPHKTALPFGASIAAGLIALLLSLTVPYSPLYPIGQIIGSVFPSEMQVTDDGVIPVDAVKVTQIMSLSDQMDDGDFGKKPEPEPSNFFGAGKWERKADMPTARRALSSATVNGKIYLISGGEDLGQLATPVVEEYDPETDTWTKKADIPSAVMKSSASVVNGKIYVIGGYANGISNATLEYDPVTDIWTKKANIPEPRAAHLSAVVDGKIYVIGGSPDGGSLVSSVYVYNPETDTWTEKANMLTARGDFAGGVVNGKIYAIGGFTVDNGQLVLSSLVEEYDPVTDTWTQKGDMPSPARGIFDTSVVNGKIYVIGGYNGTSSFSIVDEYDPLTDTWERKADMPTARNDLATSAVDGRIYAFGGVSAASGGKGMATVEVFDTGFVPSTVSVKPQGKLPTTWGKVKAAQ